MGTVASQITSWLFTQPFIQVTIKEKTKLRVTGFCVWNSPVTGEFPAQRASNAENISVWWRHHECVESGSMPSCNWNQRIDSETIPR